MQTARGDDYRGFTNLGVVWQINRDAALAAYLGLEGPPRGVVIRGTRTGSSACGVLRARDVLLSLDGYEIDTVGNYQHSVYGRIRFTHIAVDGHHPGDVLIARVLRRFFRRPCGGADRGESSRARAAVCAGSFRPNRGCLSHESATSAWPLSSIPETPSSAVPSTV